MRTFTATVILFALVFAGAVTAHAQSDDTTDDNEPLYQELQSTFKNDYLSIGSLIQVVGDFQSERTRAGQNGFSIANARLSVSGELDQGFGYLLQTKFDRSPAILDAKVYWQRSSAFQIDAGLFKSPFSYELLTGAGAIDFVNRSEVVSTLAPARQIGVQLSGRLGSERLSYAAGAFNGNGFGGNGNDDNNLLYSGRLAYHTETSGAGDLIIGANAAVSEDERVTLPGLVERFEGTRWLTGIDGRWTTEKILVSGEYIYSGLDFADGPVINPYGFHATAGYMVAPNTQVLLRWDQFTGDNFGSGSKSLIAGLNVWPTEVSEIQVNYVIPTDESIERSQVLLNFQVGF